MKGNIYHITNRGVEKRKIFLNNEYYFRFINNLYDFNNIDQTPMSYKDRRICNLAMRKPSEGLVDIISVCLMPNHYHFLVQQLTETELSKWLRKIFVGYSQAINKQQNRSGTLFEGRPKHISIDKEEYLDHLMWYIHTNPVSAGLISKPERWKFSNYQECIGKRDGIMVDKNFINERYGSFYQYETFINEYECNESLENKMGKYLFD